VPFDDLTGTVVQKICMACSREFNGNVGQCPHDGNTLVSLPADQWLERRLDNKYIVKKKLGTGGMGEVYLAWHEMMQTWVAIKFLKSSFVEDGKAIQRFQQEAMAAKRLKHNNVIDLHDFDVAPTGQPYMVMEYLVGYDKDHPAISLAQLIKQRHAAGGLTVETIIHVVAQACDALEHAHRQGVIHRDVKPANIMIVPTEEDKLFVKVVDFGVAKLLPINNLHEESQSLTTFGEVCGSPVYMSPEQCGGHALDARADIYSMGVVLYEAITGKLPLIGRNMVETMQKHMEEKPKPFNSVRPDLFVPERLEQVTMRALSKAPHLRQQSMAELAQDLRFSIPRAGSAQSPNIKAFTPELPEDAASTTAPQWMWPSICAGLTVVLVATVFAFMSHNPNKGTTSSQPATPTGTTPPAAVQATGTVRGNLGQPTATSSVNPSSSGSPATTGGISATIDTNNKTTSIIDPNGSAKITHSNPVPAVRTVVRHSESTTHTPRAASMVKRPIQSDISNADAAARFNKLKQLYSFKRNSND
jgi:serine/threonine protein kinase